MPTPPIALNISLRASNGSVEATERRMQIDQAIVGSDGGFRTIGNGAEEDLTVTDVTAYGLFLVTNESVTPTHNIKYGPKSGGVMVPFGLLKPGESAVLRLDPTVTIRMIAMVAPIRISFVLLED